MNKWEILSAGSFRFYHHSPRSGIEVYFTTRRQTDEGHDHNNDISHQSAALGLSGRLVVMKQTHSDKVLRVSNPGEIEADGCFSTEQGLALSVRVADCVPLFFTSKGGDLIGVVHAGWRGTAAKIALRFVEQVESETGIPHHHLSFFLGPSIGSCCYQVGDDVLKVFTPTWPNAGEFFSRKREGLYLDLREANRFLLKSAGAREGSSLNQCTSCEKNRFYSWRREKGAGRNWGIIIRP